MSETVVFAGPSLTADDRASYPGVTFRPPVADGDLFALADRPVAAVGLIDGFFGDRPALGHKEILWLMARGVRVVGGGSLGALRAAELDVLGMEGVGETYRSYRSGSLRDDGDVAVVHGPELVGFRALTVARVDIAATLAALAARERLTAAERDRIAAVVAGMCFTELTWDGIARRSEPDDPAPLGRLLASAHVERKRLDALEVLQRVTEPAGSGLRALPYDPPRTITFRRQMSRGLRA